MKVSITHLKLAGAWMKSCPAALILSILSFCITPMASAVSLTVLQSHLPEAVNGWKADPQDRIFDPTSIFSYINGAAEVYKAYNMRRCLSRRYSTTNGPPIVLDIFDMGSSEDAYGVFTHDTDGEVIEVGQDARLRPGWLSFWKHQFFVSIYMEEETTAAEIAVKKLGRLVAAQIPTTGTRPRILSKLPSTGLVFESIRYLHHPMVLNYHFYLSDENILNISAQTDAALADYRRGSGEAKLLLISYSDAEIAREALSRFFRHYLPDADKNGTALLENQKWSAAVLKDRLLAIVLESDSRELAESLLKTVSKKPA